MKTWQVVSIPTEENSFIGALGISEDRRIKLFDVLSTALARTEDSKSEVLESITGQCENINEACFLAFMFGEYCGSMNRSLSGLEGILLDIKKRAEKRDNS